MAADVVFGSTASLSNEPHEPPSPAPTKRVLPNLLTKIVDPVQSRMDEEARLRAERRSASGSRREAEVHEQKAEALTIEPAPPLNGPSPDTAFIYRAEPHGRVAENVPEEGKQASARNARHGMAKVAPWEKWKTRRLRLFARRQRG